MARLITEPFKAADMLIFSVKGNTDYRTNLSAPDDGSVLGGGQVSNALAVDGPFGSGVRIMPLPSPIPDVRMGWYWFPRASGSAGGTTMNKGPFLHFRRGANLITYLSVNTIGKIQLYDKNSVLLVESSQALSADLWRHLQVSYDVASSGGQINVYIDDNLEMQYTGDTAFAQTGIDNLYLPETDGFSAWSSFYLNDTTGPAPWNALEGIVQMPTVTVIADSAGGAGFLQWTPVPGSPTTLYTKIDELPFSIADLISSTVNGQKAYVIPGPHNLVLPTRIRAILARWIPIKISTGQVTPSFRVGGTEYPKAGGPFNVNVSPSILMDYRPTNPNTSLPWALTDTFEVGLISTIPA